MFEMQALESLEAYLCCAKSMSFNRLACKVIFMQFSMFRSVSWLAGAVLSLLIAVANGPASAQVPGGSSATRQSSSSSSAPLNGPQEKAPSLVDPAGPTISLISSEQVFVMAAALNACGYDEGLADSPDVRRRVRAEVDQALAKSEQARAARDAVCLYIAQHRMTGTAHDISQYISLALYLTPPPELET